MIGAFFRRNLFEPLWTLKTGSPKVPYWRFLEKTQYLSEEELKLRQWAKFKEIVGYAYHHNAFYRALYEKAGIHPDNIGNAKDIKKLPVVTKYDIRSNYDAIISQGFDKNRLLHSKTGGSTGVSLKLYKTEECSELKNACARRSDRWSGWDVGEPIAALWGSLEVEKESIFKDKIKKLLIAPVSYLNTMNINENSVSAFADKWKKTKPTLLFGHSHSIFILAKYLKNLKIKLRAPKGIITTSMMLLDSERAYIEKEFCAKVFDRYGCEEVSLIASECEKHEGYHLNIEHLFIEFVKPNGEYAKPGEQGKIIVTDLLNKAMPFIRYQVDDFGIPSDSKCSCGRGLPLMGKIVGRVADFLVRKDGSLVAGVSIIDRTLTSIRGIEQMQIIQEDLDNISVNLVREPSFTANSKSQLINELKFSIGFSTNIKIIHVDRIIPEKSGKYRFCISHVKPKF